MRDVIQNFLAKLSVIEYKYRVLEEGEERFNIFTALHKVNDEVRLFSRFLSVLLSPEGSHKRKDQFLKLFLKVLSIENFDTKHCEVYPTEKNKSEYKNIDILIINRVRKQAIIVENKIWAGDSNSDESGQLERYFNLIHQEESIPKENIKVFYLTPDRREPSDESLGAYKTLDNMNGATIGYGTEILSWLNLCLIECINSPFLRESILQFMELIEDMTNNNSTIEERLEIKQLIGYSADNMKSTKLLIDNFKHVKWHTVSEFWNELANALRLKGYEIVSEPTDRDISNTTHYESYKHGYETLNDYGLYFKTSDGMTLYVWNGTGDYWLFWGVVKSDNIERISSFVNANPTFFKVNGVHVWKEFNLEDHENIFLPDFSYEGTFNLIDKDYRTKMIADKLIPEIEDFLNVLNM